MRNWGLTLVLSALAVALLAVPASAQNDLYGEVLPEDLSQPGDSTAPPDDAAAPATEEAGERPGSSAAERPKSTSAADRPGPVAVRAAGNPVTVAGRQLPVTGGELTITLLALGGIMVAAGAAAVTVNRRRGQA